MQGKIRAGKNFSAGLVSQCDTVAVTYGRKEWREDASFRSSSV